MIDPMNPANHGKPLWVVYGSTCAPIVMCCKLLAYSATHTPIPPGEAGPKVCIWGYSVWKRVPGFRTIGMNVAEWQRRERAMPPIFFDSQDAAFEKLRELTTPVGT